MRQPFSLVVNAGGKSQRMGQPKALLPMPPRDEPLLQSIVTRLQTLQPETTIIVANDPAIRDGVSLAGKIKWLSDQYSDVGPLGGMATGLHEVAEWALLVACDMPLISPELCAQLLTLTDSVNEQGQLWDAIVPVVNGYVEPMHALYHHRCLPAMVGALDAGKRRANAFLSDVATYYVEEAWLQQFDPTLQSFTNVNRPEEWRVITEQL